MKPFLPLFVAGTLLMTACDTKNDNTDTTATVTAATLSESDLYNKQAVLVFLQRHKTQDEQATALFMKGIDAYRNKKDIMTAAGLFRQSALQYPTAKAYYELGNVNLDRKDYKQAIMAYHLSEQLGFSPLSKLLYNTACAYSLSGQKDTAVHYLEYALEAGYSNIDQIMKDPDLALARTSGLFAETFQMALGGHQDPETVAWLSFKRGFTAASFPVVLNRETEKTITDNNSISYEFEKFVPEMKGERFSREVGKEFYYVTKVMEEPAFTTVIYAAKNVMMGEEAPVGYLLVSFTDKGKLIDKMLAGGQLQPADLYKVATLQKNGRFEIKEYRQQYEKDPAENGYDDNKLLSSDLKNTKRFRIGNDGHFESDEQMVGLR